MMLSVARSFASIFETSLSLANAGVVITWRPEARRAPRVREVSSLRIFVSSPTKYDIYATS
jgi:hypothetical protein